MVWGWRSVSSVVQVKTEDVRKMMQLANRPRKTFSAVNGFLWLVDGSAKGRQRLVQFCNCLPRAKLTLPGKNRNRPQQITREWVVVGEGREVALERLKMMRPQHWNVPVSPKWGNIMINTEICVKNLSSSELLSTHTELSQNVSRNHRHSHAPTALPTPIISPYRCYVLLASQDKYVQFLVLIIMVT